MEWNNTNRVHQSSFLGWNNTNIQNINFLLNTCNYTGKVTYINVVVYDNDNDDNLDDDNGDGVGDGMSDNDGDSNDINNDDDDDDNDYDGNNYDNLLSVS